MERRDLVDADYHLAGSARDLGFVKIAADELDEVGNELGIAEYHAFAGVSGARAAVDAAASWLNELETSRKNRSGECCCYGAPNLHRPPINFVVCWRRSTSFANARSTARDWPLLITQHSHAARRVDGI